MSILFCTCIYMVHTLTIICCSGKRQKLGGLCAPWCQPPQTKQSRVCAGSSTRCDPWGRTSSISKLVGVCLQDGSPNAALPTKLAEWIGENLQEELGFPDKADKLAEPGTGWTAAELNGIQHNHVVTGILTSFGCVEWESDLFRGVMRARCYPFDMKRRFHSANPKVSNTKVQNTTFNTLL